MNFRKKVIPLHQAVSAQTSQNNFFSSRIQVQKNFSSVKKRKPSFLLALLLTHFSDFRFILKYISSIVNRFGM